MELITLILTIFLVSIPSLYYLNIYLKRKRLVSLVNKLPGPKSVPFLGTVKETWGSREDFVDLEKKIADKYGPLYRTWVGSFPVIHITKAEHAEILLKDTKNITKGQGSRFTVPWLGRSILLSTGSVWHSKRKLLTPVFHFKILEDFTKVFIEKSEILVKNLEEECKKGEYFDIFLPIKLCGLDIICKTAMGIDLNTMDHANKVYERAVDLATELTLKRGRNPWLHYDLIFKMSSIGKEYYKTVNYLHEYTNNVIQEKKKLLRKDERVEEDDVGKKKRLAFLDLLLRTDNLSDSEIQHEVDTFMFAGHDTTMVATSWCLFLLGNHPGIQEKVHEELDSIFHEKERSMTMSNIKDLKYLEMCIKEALRLYPSAPNIVRSITHPITIGGYEIPVGCNVRIHIHRIHRDPDHYPEPDRFNPDNFLPDKCSKRHPFAFVPFSAGLRNCIGQRFAYLEEKVLLTTILRKFKVCSLIKPEEMKVYHEFVMKAQNGIQMKLEKR